MRLVQTKVSLDIFSNVLQGAVLHVLPPFPTSSPALVLSRYYFRFFFQGALGSE